MVTRHKPDLTPKSKGEIFLFLGVMGLPVWVLIFLGLGFGPLAVQRSIAFYAFAGVSLVFLYDLMPETRFRKMFSRSTLANLEAVEDRWATLIKGYVLGNVGLPQDNALKVIVYPKFRRRLNSVEVFAAPLDERHYPGVKGDSQNLARKLHDALVQEVGAIKGPILAYLFLDRSLHFEIRADSNHEILAAQMKYATHNKAEQNDNLPQSPECQPAGLAS